MRTEDLARVFAEEMAEKYKKSYEAIRHGRYYNNDKNTNPDYSEMKGMLHLGRVLGLKISFEWPEDKWQGADDARATAIIVNGYKAAL